MPGGLLNLISVGQGNIYLNGNPKKTFWKSSYSRYTNFGMQKYRLDFDGTRKLRLNEQSKFIFKYPRYADLVMDSYLVVTLPNIWSPLYPILDNKHSTNNNCNQCFKDANIDYKNPCNVNIDNFENITDTEGNSIKVKCNNTYYIPYNFKWIENLGIKMIDQVEVIVGGMTLQKYSGDYLLSMIQRDFSKEKKELIKEMIGDTHEFTDPEKNTSNGKYPNAVYDSSRGGAEPSIRGKSLFIPLNLWFGLNSKQAFPLIALQYNELEVHITMKPIKELFTIRDVMNPYNNYNHKAPNFNEPTDQLYRFLHQPQGVSRRYDISDKFMENLFNSSDSSSDDSNKDIYRQFLNKISNSRSLGPPETSDDFLNSYLDKRNLWDADIHIISTYIFLSDDERRVFAAQPHEYLIKDIREQKFHNVVNSQKLSLDSMGMVASWMWFARRSDAYLRNEWSNYTNKTYKNSFNQVSIPSNNYTAKQPWYYNNNGACPICSSSDNDIFAITGCYACKVLFKEDDIDNDELLTFLLSDKPENNNRFKSFNNINIELPNKNPYANSNYNRWMRAREYNINPETCYTSDSFAKNETILDQPGFYPPTIDTILDYKKGPYTGVTAVTSSNGSLTQPVWPEQGSINTNYPVWCPPYVVDKDNTTEGDCAPDESIDNVPGISSSNFIQTNSIGYVKSDDPTPEFYGCPNGSSFPLSESLPKAISVQSVQSDLSNILNIIGDEWHTLESEQQEMILQQLTLSENQYISLLEQSKQERFKELGINSEFWGSPYKRTAYPLYWGSNHTLPSPFSTSGKYLVEKEYRIIKTNAILLDGKYRENIFDNGIYEYIEKYTRTSGGSNSNGLMCYNFCLNTNPFDLQPSGAINLSKFVSIELELTTTTPPLDPIAQFSQICRETSSFDNDGNMVSETEVIGVNKNSWSIYSYTYDITLMEERYNVVKFVGGNVGLAFSR